MSVMRDGEEYFTQAELDRKIQVSIEKNAHAAVLEIHKRKQKSVIGDFASHV